MIIFLKILGLEDCQFGQIGTIKARRNNPARRNLGEIIRLRNRSKLVERSLFVIIDLLQGAKSILLCFIRRVGE